MLGWNLPRTTMLLAVLVLLAVPLTSVAGTSPQLYQQDRTLGTHAEAFAWSEEHLAVGNPFGAQGGEVLVYDRGGGQLSLEATLAGPTDDGWFGKALAFDGDRLAVGANGQDVGGVGQAGAAHVFVETADGTWEHQAEVVSPDPAFGNQFGASIDLAGDRLAVGEPRASERPFTDGAAHVFVQRADGFDHVQKITPPTDRDAEALGYELAFDDGELHIGGHLNEVGDGREGSIFVYAPTADGWRLSSTVDPPAGVEQGGFGKTFAIDGDSMIVASPGDQYPCCGLMDVDDSQSYAFVYERAEAGWQHEATLDPLLANDGTGVALDVALADGTAYVGVTSNPASTYEGPTVSVFEEGVTGWTQVGEVAPEEAPSASSFGRSLSAEGDQLLVGTGVTGPRSDTSYVLSKVEVTSTSLENQVLGSMDIGEE